MSSFELNFDQLVPRGIPEQCRYQDKKEISFQPVSAISSDYMDKFNPLLMLIAEGYFNTN